MRTINTGWNSGLVGNIGCLLEEAYQSEGSSAEVRYGSAVLENLETRGYSRRGLQQQSALHGYGPWQADDSLPPDLIQVSRTRDEACVLDEAGRLAAVRQQRLERGDPPEAD